MRYFYLILVAFLKKKKLDQLFGCVCTPDEGTPLLRKRIVTLHRMSEAVGNVAFGIKSNESWKSTSYELIQVRFY